MKLLLIPISAAILLSGCSTLETKPYNVGTHYKIENFPTLEEKIVYLDTTGIKEKCQPHVEKPSLIAMACASINLYENSCTIYIEKNAPQHILMHEKFHCQGWDHQENGKLHQGYNKWLKYNASKNNTVTTKTSE